MPGYSDARVYPLTPDPAKAMALARGRGRTAVLYTCEQSPCPQQAQILKTDLAAIGPSVEDQGIPGTENVGVNCQARRAVRHHHVWLGGQFPGSRRDAAVHARRRRPYPAFDDPTYQRRLLDTGRLTGPERYLAYGKLDIDLTLNAAPLLAHGNSSVSDFLSARVGCETYGIYGLDLAALCIKPRRR